MGTEYKLKVVNHSEQDNSFCIYQTYPEDKNNGLFSLAWLVKKSCQKTSVAFNWTIDYSMVWSESGELRPGVMFYASQTKSADLKDSTTNSLILDYDKAFHFVDNKGEGQAGVFTINTSSKVPNKKASIGVGMGGKPAVALDAYSNMKYQFLPHPTYWIVFGNFQEGEVLGINSTSKCQEIVFPTNTTKKTITFTEDNQWEIAD